MKNSTKILNLLTAFMAVIGVCAAVLVCFIVIYTQINGSFTLKENKTSSPSYISNQTGNHELENASPLSSCQYDNSSSEMISNDDTLSELQMSNSQTVATTSEDKNIPSECKSALNSANSYSNLMHMSKAGIYDQLVSEYGENFSPEAAQYAIDNMTVDWNSNALQKAKEYSDTMHMSKAAIYDQLTSNYGEKFTQVEAQYAIDNLVADYNFNALQKAKEYQNLMNMSPSAIHDQLTSEYGEKFTQAEADYAINNIEIGSDSSSTLYSMPVEQGTSGTNFIAENPIQSTSTQSNTLVWIDDTAAKYHRQNGCGMDNAYQVSLEEAIAKGKTACGRCYKYG